MDAKTKILLIGAPGETAGLAAAVARLATRLDTVFIERLEAQIDAQVEAGDLPAGCSSVLPCPDMAPCGSGSFCGYGNYCPAPTIEELVANALRTRPRPVARPYVPKTIGTPYRGYASTYRRHRP